MSTETIASPELAEKVVATIEAQPVNVQSQYASKLAEAKAGRISAARAITIISHLRVTVHDTETVGVVPPTRSNTSGDNASSHKSAGATERAIGYARSLILAKLPKDAQAVELAKLEGTPGKLAVSAIIDRLKDRADVNVTEANLASPSQVSLINNLMTERGQDVSSLTPENLTKIQASVLIDTLRKIPVPASAAPVKLEPGMYKVGDEVFKVQQSRQSGNLYAKRLEAHGFEYAAGAIRKIKPEHRMTLDEAKAYGRETGVCCNCGAELTDPKSIEAGIGPICASRI